MKTISEIYRRASQHLLAQMEKAVEPRSTGGYVPGCTGNRYLTSTGLRCGVGVLIPPTSYTWMLEGASVNQLWSGITLASRDVPRIQALKEALAEGGVNTHDSQVVGLLFNLQDCHDNYEPVDWPDRLASIGRHHGVAV